jgi:hypothetical protein
MLTDVYWRIFFCKGMMWALGWSCMGMLGLTLLSRTVAFMTLNKWLRRVCKQGFLETQALCNREFLGGTLVRANELVICGQSNKQDN